MFCLMSLKNSLPRRCPLFPHNLCQINPGPGVLVFYFTNKWGKLGLKRSTAWPEIGV